MNKLKDFFWMIWYFITYPFYRKSYKRVDKKLRQAGEEYRKSLLNERDVEFFKSIGIETDLETLRGGGE